MIRIGSLRKIVMDHAVRLESTVYVDGTEQTLFFETGREYEDDIFDDRADPFLVILLTYAMTNREDIVCEDGITAELLYQIREYLIPNLTENTERFHHITITAKPLPSLEAKSTGVGTGFSGGVDSLYTVVLHKDRQDSLKLTHLAVFNAGVYEGPMYRMLYQKALKETHKFAVEQGLSCIGVDTNITDIVTEHYLGVASYRILACAMAVRGVFRTFLLSSAYELYYFQIVQDNVAFYDLLLAEVFSTRDFRICISGEMVRRIDKIKLIASAPASIRNVLHVCVKYPVFGQKNCSLCAKCYRTVLALEKLEKLSEFGECFSLDLVREKHDELLAKALASSKNVHVQEAIGSEIEVTDRIKQKLRGLNAAKEVVMRNRELLRDKITDNSSKLN